MKVLKVIYYIAIIRLFSIKILHAKRHNYTTVKPPLACRDQKFIENSEVVYWQIVPGDKEYESPITPHHHEHKDKYITFEFDHGGWNNMRMGFESLLVAAHAMGRTLVMPPEQYIYLLNQHHKDDHDKKPHVEMSFGDFYNMSLIQQQEGMHIMSMREFLAKEAVTGRLKDGKKPPGDNVDLVGRAGLWKYLSEVADLTPLWWFKFFVFPDELGIFRSNSKKHGKQLQRRMKEFSNNGERQSIRYNKAMQQAKHIHIRGDGDHRILQHFYAFNFFVSRDMSSFYKRFIRDFVHYRDDVQCYAHEIIRSLRRLSRARNPSQNGKFYAMHIRRGDLQFKDVKISAKQIVENLRYPNGTSIIPRGSLVYLATDDPDGLCKGCSDDSGKDCRAFKKDEPLPLGCMQDTTWNAFLQENWELRFLRDFTKKKILNGLNPNLYGILESIVSSRADIFAGTFKSTFTGYIHRLRGYHGLGEETYYHTTNEVFSLQAEKSVGEGWPREWRTGWTDDNSHQLV